MRTLELTDRQQKILFAIIQTYQETGEPVGSRTISKYTDLQLSSATIRNEMADLEEMGLIVQPHTSAGRVPTDTGYRIYVDTMMQDNKKQISDLHNFYVERVDRVENMLKQVVKLLAVNTNYATMISAPRSKGRGRRFKFIQLSLMENGQMLVVVVIEGNTIRNSIIDLDTKLEDTDVLSLNAIINSNLTGRTLSDINIALIRQMENEAAGHKDIIDKVVRAIADAIGTDDDMQIYTSGATNIFRYPELTDGQTAQDIIGMFEEKLPLGDIITRSQSEEGDSGDIRVYIGEENSVDSMKDCSVVTANYEFGDGVTGTVGIVGPKRMDYEKVVSTLQNLKEQLNKAFREDDRKDT